ncbi:MAG: Segregation and condensation protein A [Firmicutes bacterium]|nr:Segregation and condensation protein A [Bacillota bacterium]MDI6707156.1 segregation/condensation protein A [Bacillota bacterium]
MTYRVKLEVFEGPFDLLFHLIEKNEVDIYDIPIAEITAQYLQYLEDMRYFDIEVASEFLVMAATLIQIKSRMLLPQQEEDGTEEDIDPRQQLVERLIEYRKYKGITEELKKREDKYQLLLFREPSPVESYVDYEPILINIDISDLCKAFDSVMKRYSSLYNEDTGLERSIRRESITVVDKIKYITNRLRYEKEVLFQSLFGDGETRESIVVTFLAMLELIRLKRIMVEQRNTFGDIIIRNRKTKAGDK